MKHTTTQTYRIAIITLSLIFLCGMAAPGFAGPAKYRSAESSKTTTKNNGTVNSTPAPIVDDTPINPDSTTQKNNNKNPPKTNPGKQGSKKKNSLFTW